MSNKLQQNKGDSHVFKVKNAIIASKKLPNLRFIRTNHEDKYYEFMSEAIANICSHFNETWNIDQIEDCISAITLKGYYLNQVDIKVFFLNCVTNKYELKFRFLPNVLIEWLDWYMADRAREAAMMQKFTPAEITPLSDKAKEVISELKAKFEPVKEIEVKVNPTPFESKVNEYIREFDKIFKQQWQPKEKEDMIRTIEVEGKQLTKEQFIKYKIYES